MSVKEKHHILLCGGIKVGNVYYYLDMNKIKHRHNNKFFYLVIMTM